ncbi:MAG: TolC family protein [Polyangiales bacterium]
MNRARSLSLSRAAASIAALLFASVAHGQNASRTLTRDAFLREVVQSNITLAAERANIPIARAQIAVARIFPDPAISVGVTSLDVSRVGAQNTVGAAVNIPIEWPGRAAARVEVASQELRVSEAQLEDALRQLRSAASTAFVEALAAKLELAIRRQSLASLERFVTANRVRLQAGDIGDVALAQTRIEAERYRAEVLTSEGETAATSMALRAFLGQYASAQRIEPDGDIRVSPVVLDEAALVARALRDRADLQALRLARSSANARVNLARVNRGVDFAVGLGWQYYFPGAQGSAFQAPDYHALSATLTVPLPFSRVHRGELDAARALTEQSERRVQAAELAVEFEVRQAVARYRAALAALAVYEQGLLRDAERVVESISYGYSRGSVTLLEVLSAQRTLDDVRHSHVDALAAVARARVALELAIGGPL